MRLGFGPGLEAAETGEAGRVVEKVDQLDDSGRRLYTAELPDDSGEKPYSADLPDDSGEQPYRLEGDSWKEAPAEAGGEKDDDQGPLRRKEKIDGETHYYDDNGKLYRKDGELIPNNTYEINTYQYETDQLGRIVSASGTLHMKDREGKLPIADSMQTIGKGDEKEGDDRGHLIGDQFDGGNGLENMVPQDARINEKDFNSFETHVLAAAVKEGKEVRVEVIPVYEGDSRRPAEIAVTYSIDGKMDTRIFPNNKEDI